MNRYLRVALITCLLILTLAAACGRGQGKATPPASVTGTPVREEKAPTATPKSAAVAEFAYGEANDLSGLKSYRLRNVITWQEEGGESNTMEMTVAYVREPSAQQIAIKGQGEGMTKEGMEIIRIGTDSYARFGQEWIAMQVPDEEVMPPASTLYRPENVFGAAKGRYVGEESVNGEPTKHYVFEKEAIAKSGLFETLLEASGEAWVSTRYNVVVRSTARVKGKDVQKGKVVTLDLHYEVTDLNAKIEIKPPEGVEKPQLPADVPIMAGATDMVSMMGMTSYKVSTSLDKVTEFYQTEMPKNGWKSTAVMAPGMLGFEKEKRTAQIIIKQEGDRTAVAIVIQEK